MEDFLDAEFSFKIQKRNWFRFFSKFVYNKNKGAVKNMLLRLYGALFRLSVTHNWVWLYHLLSSFPKRSSAYNQKIFEELERVSLPAFHESAFQRIESGLSHKIKLYEISKSGN